MIKFALFLTAIFGSFCISTHSYESQKEIKCNEIALLDLNDFLHDNSRDAFVVELGEALSNYGFVLIKNHNISSSAISSACDSAKQFFSMPVEIKKSYQGLKLNRGYKGYDRDRLDKKSDLQEYWHVGPPQVFKSQDVPSIQENIWPLEIESFEENLSNLYGEIAIRSQPILEACSLYMGKDKEFLSDLTRHGDSIMRVIHYLPNPEDSSCATWKAPHRDPNLLTIIVGISKEGLELQTKEGKWISVPYVPDAIVVSASNMLESLSNGLIRSAPHRVTIKENDVSRFSIPFFFHVQQNLSIGPQAECVAKTGGEVLYPEQTAEEALKDRQWFVRKVGT
jgi:isopenicillin N synthase-like dioxygenase